MDGVPVHLVRVRLEDRRVRVQPVLARGGIGSSESLAALAGRGAKAALTGAFFDTRSLQPMGDIVVGGKLVHFGGRGAALCLRRAKGGAGWSASIRANAGTDRHTDWGKSEVVLAGGIHLVQEGDITVRPQRQGFSGLLEKPDPRVGVGITEAGELLLAATKTPVSLTRWAQIFRKLGAVDALNYDGGSSAGLYVDGKARVKPGRKLTNALAVYVAQKGKRAPRRT